MYKVLLICFLFLPRPSCTNSDKLAQLIGTLRLMEQAACDDQAVSLVCPRGTIITIQAAEYGRTPTHGKTCKVEEAQVVPVDLDFNTCLWPNSMQYSLLQKVVEQCQRKTQCKFSAKPNANLSDPCPATKKFVDVKYKCRAHDFRSRSSCSGEAIELECNPHSRIAILEAQYGRKRFDSNICAQSKDVVSEDCLSPYATDTVLKICHGKRRCYVENRSDHFGTPCIGSLRSYLTVIYACVPQGTIMEKYEASDENDETNSNFDGETDKTLDFFDNSEEANKKWGPPKQIPFSPPQLTFDEPEFDLDQNKQDNDGKKQDVTSAPKPDAKMRQSEWIIYIAVGIATIFFAIALFIGICCFLGRKKRRNSKNGDMFTTEAPNVFNEDISDVDNDVDINHISGTFYEHPDMILYRDGNGKGALRAMKPLSAIYPCSGMSMYGNVDFVPQERNPVCLKEKDDSDGVIVSPKSLGRTSNSRFYYD